MRNASVKNHPTSWTVHHPCSIIAPEQNYLPVETQVQKYFWHDSYHESFIFLPTYPLKAKQLEIVNLDYYHTFAPDILKLRSNDLFKFIQQFISDSGTVQLKPWIELDTLGCMENSCVEATLSC